MILIVTVILLSTWNYSEYELWNGGGRVDGNETRRQHDEHDDDARINTNNAEQLRIAQ